MNQITEEEIAVINLLGKAMVAFCELPVIHPADTSEFALAIHAAQNIVLARPGMRDYQEIAGFKYSATPPHERPADRPAPTDITHQDFSSSWDGEE